MSVLRPPGQAGALPLRGRGGVGEGGHGKGSEAPEKMPRARSVWLLLWHLLPLCCGPARPLQRSRPSIGHVPRPREPPRPPRGVHVALSEEARFWEGTSSKVGRHMLLKASPES